MRYMKTLNANCLYSCYVHDLDLNDYIYTVVYKINDTYYDMRLINNPFDLFIIGRLTNILSYNAGITRNGFYGTQRVLLKDTLEPYYKDGRETFLIEDLLNDMVNDENIFTDWPGFSTYLIHERKRKEERQLQRKR